MKLSTVMILNTILAGVFGVAFVLVPGQVVSLYGIPADPILKYMAQLFGASLIALALLTWSARNATDSDARKGLVLALFVGDAIGFIVALICQLNNVVNALGWLNVAIYLILTLGFGYYQFAKRVS
jgi:hypothetical protein